MADTPEDRLAVARAAARLSLPSIQLKRLAADLDILLGLSDLGGREAAFRLRADLGALSRALETLERRVEALE